MICGIKVFAGFRYINFQLQKFVFGQCRTHNIIAVYIRDVLLPERRRLAEEIGQSFSQYKTEMLIVENTVEAAEHAAKTGLIFTEAIPAIERDKKEDKGQEPGKEEATLLGQ